MNDRKPFLVELDDNNPPASPDTAPPLPDDEGPPQQAASGRAMLLAMRGARARLTLWAKLGWAGFAGFMTIALSVTAWDFITSLVARSELLGYIALGLLTLLVAAACALALREWAGIRRLHRIDRLRQQAGHARAENDRAGAAQTLTALMGLYASRPDMRWPCERMSETAPDQLDAESLLDQAEATLLAPLDAAARLQVEASARQVALLTAMIPLALVDVIAALVTNLRMIRRIAEIYGGRAGTLGSVRLLRGVITHLLATGAVAVGEDMIGAVASGGIVSKLSRRFGEGVVNGALTARLGIAAIEICRPLPFRTLPRPRTSTIMRRAVSGLFDKAT
ncbi:YcjF family protein [Roseinatronobacter alkalisoli]|uniref:TIGR01620 family protein n=1 Tax=Roseinatronobacter alkalisoli TaxID=3028235 RepID=A0ABT5TBT7_9RHOB|nr:TIGR01620 family protein [Roseinatronobacter sp. HJB301]MDD7972577.1 TIGR01620 family protein [Roseinatronobacter sp. HJB301]